MRLIFFIGSNKMINERGNIVASTRNRRGGVRWGEVRRTVLRRCLLALAFLAIVPLGSGGDGYGVIGAREVYRSNAVGVIISQLPADTPITNPGYLLVVDERDQERTERLYRDGELVRRLNSVTAGRIRTESIYRDSIITEESTYDSSARLLSTVNYDADGKPQRSIRYTHRSNSIIAEHFDSNEELLFREQQTIDQNGRVIEIVRDYTDGRTEKVQFVFLDRRLLREVHQLNNLTLTLKYDSVGRLIREEHSFDDQLRKEVDYRYGPQITDRIPKTIYTVEQSEELTVRMEQINDRNGQPIEELLYEDDILVEEASFTYEQDKLRSARIHRTGSTSQRELIYDQSGGQIEERWYENGRLVRSISEEGGGESAGETVELRYVDGRPYVRIFFKNGTRVKEEFLTGDEITRERVLE